MIRKIQFAIIGLFALCVLGVSALATSPAYFVPTGEDIVVGSFVTNTGTGSQSVTGLGGTPKAILFYSTGQNSTDEVTDEAYIYLGWTDCTDEGMRISRNVDNQDTSVAGRSSVSDNDIWRTISATPAVIAEATFTSCDSDGFTWNITTNDGVARRIAYMAFMGTTVQAKVGTFTKPNATGAQSTTGVGFQPSVVLLMCGITEQSTADTTTSASGGNISLGAFNDAQQWAVSHGSTGSGNTARGITRTDSATVCSGGNAELDDRATGTSLNSDGFTVTWTDVDSAVEEPMLYLALSGVDSFLSTDNQRTSNGTTALTGFGFSPIAALAVSRNLVSSTTADDEGRFMIGASDGTNQAVAWGGADHGCGVNCATARAFATNDFVRMYTPAATGSSSTLNSAADVQSLDANGMTVNWTTTDATAREYVYAGFGLEVATPGLICWNIVPSTQTICTTIPSNVQDNITRLGTLVSWAIGAAPTITDGIKITFNPNGTNAGINVGSQAGDPSSLANGDIWYNSSSNLFKCRENGSTVSCIGSAGNIQTLLDGISTTQGVIIYYNGTDWVALATGTSGQFLQTQGASANPQWASAGSGDFTLIEEQNPSSTGVVTFSSLGSYTHLKIIYNARGTQTATATGINLTFNGDTGSNYDGERVSFTTSATFAEQIAQTSVQIGVVSAASATSNYASGGEILIPDYAGTTFFKTALSSENGVLLAQSTTNLQSRIHTGWWRSTNAITSISLTLTSGNYVSGSKFSLYGIN